MFTRKYQKRPVEVEAMLIWRETDFIAATEWMSSNLYPGLIGDASQPETLRYPDQVKGDDSRPDKGWYISPADGSLMIRTLEGDMRLNAGDMLIQGVAGEFYPCKNDIFELTYSLVEES